MCIGGRKFSWVFRYRKEFVEFTLNSMDNPTGLFKRWKLYCLKQSSDESDCKSSKICKTKDCKKLYEVNSVKTKEETKEDTENKNQKSESSRIGVPDDSGPFSGGSEKS